MIDDKEKNLGVLKYGVPHSFEYQLTNLYNQPIKIERLVLGCAACTKATMDKGTIQSNETIPVKIIFTPGSLGAQTKSLSVVSSINGTFLPETKLKFKSVVND